MHRKMTITLGPHVVDSALDDGYRAMAADKARETEAMANELFAK